MTKPEIVYSYRPMGDWYQVDMMAEGGTRVAVQESPNMWALFKGDEYPVSGIAGYVFTEEEAVRWVALGELP